MSPWRRVALATAVSALPFVVSSTAVTQNPPGGPVVTSLTLFAGTAAGLSWSRDWGGTWRPIEAKQGLADAGAIYDVLALGPRVYAGGDSGLFVSDDFGQTWTRTSLTTPVLAVLPSRYPQADPTVFAATPDGLLKSIDSGRTFQPTSLRGTPVYRLAWPGPSLLAATGSGVRTSLNVGESFEPVGPGLPKGDVRALALSSFYAVDPVSFAGMGADGVYRSSDGTRTWLSAGLAGRSVTDLVWLGPLLYAVTDGGIFRSEDTGRSWAPLGKGGWRRATRILFPLAPASGSEAFVAAEGGVFRSENGGLEFKASGLAGESVLTIATFPAPQPELAKPRKR